MATFRLLIGITLLCGLFSMSTGYNYHFMEDYCPSGISNNGVIDLNQFREGHGRLRLTRGSGYRPNMDCTLTIKARRGLGMNMRINWLEIYQPLLGCSSDRLIVYAGGRQLGPTLCGYGSPPFSYVFTQGQMTIRFTSGSWLFANYRRGFDLVYTSYRSGTCNSTAGEFKCALGDRCIPSKLKCDGLDNCADWSDESTSYAGCPYRGLSGWQIAGIVIGAMFIIIVWLVAIYFCCKARKTQARLNAQARGIQIGDGGPRVIVQPRPGESFAKANSGFEPPPPYTMTAMTNQYTNMAFVQTVAAVPVAGPRAAPPPPAAEATPAPSTSAPAATATPAPVQSTPATETKKQ